MSFLSFLFFCQPLLALSIFISLFPPLCWLVYCNTKWIPFQIRHGLSSDQRANIQCCHSLFWSLHSVPGEDPEGDGMFQGWILRMGEHVSASKAVARSRGGGVHAGLVHPQLHGAAWFVPAQSTPTCAADLARGWVLASAHCMLDPLLTGSVSLVDVGVWFTGLIETSSCFSDVVCKEQKTLSREGAGALAQGSRQLWHSSWHRAGGRGCTKVAGCYWFLPTCWSLLGWGGFVLKHFVSNLSLGLQ